MAKLKKSKRTLAPKKTASKKKRVVGKSRGGSDFEPEAKHRVKKGGAFDRVKQEKKKQELNAAKPWNVIVGVGESLTVYLLDEGEPFACYQHLNYGGAKGRRGRDLPCIQDGPNACPVCAAEGKQGTYVMYLTAVIPKETYTKKGDTRPTTRLYQKKLIQIKIKMAEVWRRLYEEHGTFRGLVVKLHRDGKLDPISGNQVTFVKKLSEAKIRQYAKAADVSDKDARDYIKKSKIDEVFDYETIFPTPEPKALAQLAGIGSSTEGMRGLGAEDDDMEDDDADDGFGSDWGED